MLDPKWHEKTNVLIGVRNAIQENIGKAKDFGIDDRWLAVFKNWSKECDQEIDYLAGLHNLAREEPQSFLQVHKHDL